MTDYNMTHTGLELDEAIDKTQEANTAIVSRGFTTQVLSIHDGLAGTETVIDFGTASNATFDIAGGVITLLQDIEIVRVITEIHVNKTSGGTNSVYSMWAEVSTDAGVSWSTFDDSLRDMVMAKDGGNVAVSVLSLVTPIAIGTKFRIVATNTGAAALTILPPPDLVTSKGTATGFATKVSIK
tara:strand:+ start:43 stop:591 length:549 start_codon:yes stop_codon:yes gene_type:complete